MRVTLVCSSLGPGGAERVVARMANYWSQQAHEVCVLTFSPADTDFFSLLPAVKRAHVDIFWVSANPLRRLLDQFARVRLLRQALIDTTPDVVVSFVDTTNVRVLVSLLGAGIPVIVSERSHPRLWPIRDHWRVLRRLFYGRAALVVTQTERVADWVRSFVPPQRVEAIPNSVSAPEITDDAPTRLPEAPYLVAMGRMGPEKGFDVLVRVWHGLANDFPDWQLVIIGDGEEREALVQQVRALGLREKVLLPGRIANPAAWLQRASVFVLSSRFEGFPNALLEGMAGGLPAVAFNCEFGPAEIIRHEVDGLLVRNQDETALAAALKRLLGDTALREQMGHRAAEVSERFSEAAVMNQWDECLNRVRN